MNRPINDFDNAMFGDTDRRLNRLESSVKQLTSKINKLSQEIEILKLYGLQDQINSVKDKVRELEKANLETRRHLGIAPTIQKYVEPEK